jgi:hypothetical protein
MTQSVTIERKVHFGRRGKITELRPGPTPDPVPVGRVPRVARLMALALRLDGLIRQGAIANAAEAARSGHVTRARMSQILSLLNLAPDIQEALLFLPPTERGRDPVILRDSLPIAQVVDWRKQRRLWADLRKHVSFEERQGKIGALEP